MKYISLILLIVIASCSPIDREDMTTHTDSKKLLDDTVKTEETIEIIFGNDTVYWNTQKNSIEHTIHKDKVAENLGDWVDTIGNNEDLGIAYCSAFENNLTKGDIAFMVVNGSYDIPLNNCFQVQFDILPDECGNNYPYGLMRYVANNRQRAVSQLENCLKEQ